MRNIGLYIIACFLLFALSNCGDDKKSEEVKIKLLEREIVIGGNEIDTLFSVPEITSVITAIQENSDWLDVTKGNSSSDVFQIQISCRKNTTTASRSTDVSVTIANGDKLKLKVTQNVIKDFDDIHDNVTDGAALAPIRNSQQ